MNRTLTYLSGVSTIVLLLLLSSCPTGGGGAATGWTKTLDGSGGQDSVCSIAVTSGQDVVFAGVGEDLVPVPRGPSGFDWWLKAFDSAGTPGYDYRRDRTSRDMLHAIAVDSNDKIYSVGSGENLVSASSGRDWLLQKYDSILVPATGNWDKK